MNEQKVESRNQKKSTLKHWIFFLSAFQLMIVLLAILGQGMHPLLFFLQITAWLIAGMVLWMKGSRRLATGLLGSLLAVIVLSMVGFYANAQVGGGEFSKGRTQVSSRSVGNALGSTVTDPATFTATLFGYECRDAFWPKCTDSLYYLGVGLVEVIFASGIALGAALGRRDKQLMSNTSG